MTVRRNALANSAGLVYSTVLGVVVVPVYLRLLGAEAYGLIAFHAVLQGWFQLLDLGMGPTLGREMARFRGGALSADGARQILRSMEMLFAGIALVAGGALFLLAPAVARHWLQARALPEAQVVGAVAVMGALAALRWVGSLYRSTLLGLERQVWLAGFDVLAATARGLLPIALLLQLTATVPLYFHAQLAIAVVELLVLWAGAHRALPAGALRLRWSLAPLREVVHFSLGVAFATVAWVALTNTDKLLLARLLPLPEFGTFSLGVLAASAITLLGGPVGQAILPRLTALDAAGDEAGLRALYRAATQWVAALVAPVTCALVVFARPLLQAWTGNAQTAASAAPVLVLYAIGNGLLSIAAFQYYLQYARGSLRLHVIGNALFLAPLLPLLIFAVGRWGATGAGWVWAGQCAVYCLCWSWLVHKRFAPGLHWSWMRRDVLPIWGAAAAVALALRLSGAEGWLLGLDRVRALLGLAAFGLAIAAAAAAGSSEVRKLAGALARRA